MVSRLSRPGPAIWLALAAYLVMSGFDSFHRHRHIDRQDTTAYAFSSATAPAPPDACPICRWHVHATPCPCPCWTRPSVPPAGEAVWSVAGPAQRVRLAHHHARAPPGASWSVHHVHIMLTMP